MAGVVVGALAIVAWIVGLPAVGFALLVAWACVVLAVAATLLLIRAWMRGSE